MFNYSDRLAKAEFRGWQGDGAERLARYMVGRHEVLLPVPGPSDTEEDGPALTFRTPRATTTPQSSFPTMEIVDGQIKIDLTDLVDDVLNRVEPVEIAQALWTNADVREAFMEKMVYHYGSDMTDAERRKFLRDVQADVHSRVLDKLASAMSDMEHAFSKRCKAEVDVHNFNTFLQGHDCRVSLPGEAKFGAPLRYAMPDCGIDTCIVFGESNAWSQARAHWRAEALKHFPAPSGVQDAPEETI